MKKIITIVSVLLAFNSIAQIEQDKVKHFVAGAVITSVVNTSVYSLTKNKDNALFMGLAAGIGAGLVKELYDSKYRGGFSVTDLVATGFGSFSASIPLVAVETLIDRKRKINLNL